MKDAVSLTEVVPWFYILIGVGAAGLLIIIISIAVVVYCRRKAVQAGNYSSIPEYHHFGDRPTFISL